MPKNLPKSLPKDHLAKDGLAEDGLAEDGLALIVGLGNPGAKYERTRHNVGFDVIDILARRWQIPVRDNSRFKGCFGQGAGPNGLKLSLLKPTTFMNRSGDSVRAVVDWYKFSPQSVLVIYDDMDLPLGRLRLRLKGSAGGHNGMRSLIQQLGTQEFPRLRLGIDSPKSNSIGQSDTVSFVLSRFMPTEQKIVTEALELAADASEYAMKQGIEKAMNVYNPKTVESALVL